MPGGSENRVLVLGSERETSQALARVLAPDSVIVTAGDVGDAVRLLDRDAFGIVVAEESVGPGGAVGLLVRAMELAPGALRVFVASTPGSDAALTAVNEARIHVLLRRPLQAATLQETLAAAARSSEERRERDAELRRLEQRNRELLDQARSLALSLEEKASATARLARQLETLSVRDPLTGLCTERYFHERAEQELKRARRHELSVSVVLCDLDGVGTRGERHAGAGAGADALLVAASRLLGGGREPAPGQVRVRETDVVARYAAESFGLLLPGAGSDGALVVAERVRAAFARRSLSPGLSSARLTVSFGIAVFPEDAGSRGELVEHADQALYRARARGKDQIVLFSQA